MLMCMSMWQKRFLVPVLSKWACSVNISLLKKKQSKSRKEQAVTKGHRDWCCSASCLMSVCTHWCFETKIKKNFQTSNKKRFALRVYHCNADYVLHVHLCLRDSISINATGTVEASKPIDVQTSWSRVWGSNDRKTPEVLLLIPEVRIARSEII